MPIVKIDLWEGRTTEQKDKIISSVTQALSSSASCPPESITVVIQDHPKKNWGIGGKQAGKD